MHFSVVDSCIWWQASLSPFCSLWSLVQVNYCMFISLFLPVTASTMKIIAILMLASLACVFAGPVCSVFLSLVWLVYFNVCLVNYARWLYPFYVDQSFFIIINFENKRQTTNVFLIHFLQLEILKGMFDKFCLGLCTEIWSSNATCKGRTESYELHYLTLQTIITICLLQYIVEPPMSDHPEWSLATRASHKHPDMFQDL